MSNENNNTVGLFGLLQKSVGAILVHGTDTVVQSCKGVSALASAGKVFGETATIIAIGGKSTVKTALKSSFAKEDKTDSDFDKEVAAFEQHSKDKDAAVDSIELMQFPKAQ